MNESDPQADDAASSQWLAALAGQPDPQADPRLNAQAAALRQALQAHSSRLDAQVPPADDQLWQQLQFRLRREALLRPAPRWRQPGTWALAATVVLAVGLGLHAGRGGHWFGRDDGAADVLRGGGGPAIELRVGQPEERLAELVAGLQAAGARPQVERLAGGRIRLQVPASAPVLDYLASQRIEPARAEGVVVLELVPAGDQR